MKDVMLWIARVVCFLLLMGVCGVPPARALLIDVDESQARDSVTGHVWLGFSVSYKESLENIREKTGDTTFRLATQAEVLGLLQNASMTEIVSHLGYAQDYTVFKVIRANLLDYYTYIQVFSTTSIIEFNPPPATFPNDYASWIVRGAHTVGAPIPEPTTFMLLLAGLTGLVAMSWSQRRRRGN